MEETPLLFRCPISMELMENPVTVATGVTYERKNIEKWLFVYKKSVCPATMQILHSFDLTPNHNLKRLISSWRDTQASRAPAEAPPPPPAQILAESMETLLDSLDSSPFKVTALKKLQGLLDSCNTATAELLRCGGVEVLARIIKPLGAAPECCDFSALRASESAVGVLHRLRLAEDEASVSVLSNPDCVKPMMVLLQRGTATARLQTLSILQQMGMVNRDWRHLLSCLDDDSSGVFKSLLELLSDELSSKLSSAALDVLIEITSASKKTRAKAVEAGAVCVLLELLIDVGSFRRCEKILLLLKQLCECAEGRLAFTEHGLAVAAVSKKLLRVSEGATKLGIKILWLVCKFLPADKFLHEMLVYGGVRKLIGVLHVDGRSSTKEKALKIIRMHGRLWRQYPCFPCELKDYFTFFHGDYN